MSELQSEGTPTDAIKTQSRRAGLIMDLQPPKFLTGTPRI